MINTSFSAFVKETLAKNRIVLSDVRRLQCDLLPDGVASRDEADLLLVLDRSVGAVDPAWTTWLVPAIVDFVVWGERPTGRVEEDAARWLAAALAHGGERARLIAQEVACEAESIHGLPTPPAGRLRSAPAKCMPRASSKSRTTRGNGRPESIPAHRGA